MFQWEFFTSANKIKQGEEQMSYRKVKKGNARKQPSGYRTGSSGAQKRKSSSGAGSRILAVIVVILLLGIVGSTAKGLILSPSRSECKEMVADFQTACNTLDTNDILNCLKPSIANPLRIALGIGSMVTSKSSEEILENILEALGGGLSELTNNSELSIQNVFELIQIEPVKISFPKKTRKVKCRANIVGLEKMIYVYVTKEGGKAYISKVAFK